MESNTLNQKLWYGGGFKFLNKFSETGYKVVYLAIWLVSLFVVSALYSALPTMSSGRVRLSEGCVRNRSGAQHYPYVSNAYSILFPLRLESLCNVDNGSQNWLCN